VAVQASASTSTCNSPWAHNAHAHSTQHNTTIKLTSTNDTREHTFHRLLALLDPRPLLRPVLTLGDVAEWTYFELIQLLFIMQQFGCSGGETQHDTSQQHDTTQHEACDESVYVAAGDGASGSER
jgi:hypothetical protein